MPDSHLDLFTGRAEGADQSFVFPVGACLLASPNTTRPVRCTDPHQAVAVGNAHLPDTPGGEPPSHEDFLRLVEARCRELARAYIGPSFQESRTFHLNSLLIDPASWRAGSHTVTCMVEYYTASGQPRSVSGDQLRRDPGIPA
ncbi:conserved hypothetical protein [Frankia canadensis]|uniref:Septum formation-related domain-containing protein n=1 Tax=Frankia canadensis TaxID=1836972 RepID=A0A2I2KIS4_9ACTN|nr:conserved hypothetical protein [Frankia canadensis]SOU52862.1 conserved hypothetical protein [Frankia canadensis]